MEQEMKDRLQWPFDPAWVMRKKNKLRRELLSEERSWTDVRIAILGGSTTNDTQDLMEVFLLAEGIRPSFYVSEYAKYWEDGMFDNPQLDEFKPQVIYIHTSSRNITQWPDISMTAEDAASLLENQYAHFEALWERLQAHYEGSMIIQNNFERPLVRLMGNQDICDFRGQSNFVYRLNGMLYDYAAQHKNFFVHDLDYLAADYGVSKWHDGQAWNLYKSAFHLQAGPALAYNLTRIIKSFYGKNKKALTLDMDNTLWSGIVGEDGPEGIEMGEGNAVGEGFRNFQQYLKQVKQTGILLSVNSKNDEENALAGLNHPDCVLKPDDFVAIKANWMSKDQNQKALADLIDIGIDSFVFIDDNPAERHMVHQQHPMVDTPPYENPEQMIQLLDHAGYFEVTNLTADDLKRSQMYQANVSRKQQEQKFENYDDYLLSLEMKATIRGFDPMNIPRISQLTNKTNQFNLTTKRFSEAEITAISEDPSYICLYGRLEDKFGDNGIVSVLFGHVEEDVLHIDLWLMSCRVLKREMELSMFDKLVEKCLEKGITTIKGYYYPTAKNHMVEKHYERLGFDLISEAEDGSTVWSIQTAGHENMNHVIEVLD